VHCWFAWAVLVIITCKLQPLILHLKYHMCLLLHADLAALAASLVLLASTALAAITLHAAAVAPTSPARLNLLVWISVCVQQDTA
jgi:hypothetical protein